MERPEQRARPGIEIADKAGRQRRAILLTAMFHACHTQESMQKQRIVAFLTLALTVLMWPVVLWLSGGSNPDEYGQTSALIITSMLMAAHLGAAVLFVMALRNFTSALKVTYAIIGVGLVTFALAQVQMPLLLVLGMRTSVYMTSGALVIPSVIGFIAMYVGVRRLARQFGVRAIWLKGAVAWVGSFAAALAAWLLPVPAVQPVATTLYFKSTVAFIAWGVTFAVVSTLILYSTVRASGHLYTKALYWFFLAQLGEVVAGLHALLAYFTLGSDSQYVNGAYLFVPQLLSGIAMLRASYLFNAAGSLAANPGHEVPRHGDGATLVDVVVCVAQLASNPASIDSLLDDVRLVTAALDDTQQLTPQQEEILLGVYKSLEHYLVTEEPVRKFTPAEIRQTVMRELGLRAGSGTILDRLAT